MGLVISKRARKSRPRPISRSNELVIPIPLSPTISLHPSQTHVLTPTVNKAYPRLPIEVCEHIIDAIGVEHTYKYGYNNTKTLLACCLTSREWFYRASIYLYTDAALYVNKITPFSEALKGHPHVREFVRTLGIWQREGQPHRDLSLLPRYFSRSLPNLTRLEFYKVDFTVVYPEYSKILHQFTAVTSVLYHRVAFQSLHQFYRHVKGFLHLEDLLFYRPAFRALEAGRPLSTALTRRYRHKLCVQTVALNLCDANDIHVFELFSPKSIATLTVWFEEDTGKTVGPALASFLHDAQHTLHSFELHVLGPIRPNMEFGESLIYSVFLSARHSRNFQAPKIGRAHV